MNPESVHPLQSLLNAYYAIWIFERIYGSNVCNDYYYSCSFNNTIIAACENYDVKSLGLPIYKIPILRVSFYGCYEKLVKPFYLHWSSSERCNRDFYSYEYSNYAIFK